MDDYEKVIALAVQVFNTARLVDGDVARVKVGFMSSPEKMTVRPRDDLRAVTFLAVQRLRKAITESNHLDGLSISNR